MMEKQNRTVRKTAAGDARDLDDIVDFAANKMTRMTAGSGHKERNLRLTRKTQASIVPDGK